MLAPSTAFACTPKDPRGKGKLDVCEQTFSMPYPTAMGQQVKSFATENIPRGAVGIRYRLTFNPKPSNATLTQSFNPDATDQNPDGSFPTPGADEQAARVLFDWSALGPSSPAMGEVTYTVTFEEKAEPLRVRIFHRPERLRAGEKVTFDVNFENPNDDPVEGIVYLGGLAAHGTFAPAGVTGSQPEMSDCGRPFDVFECHLHLLPTEQGVMEVTGKFLAPEDTKISASELVAKQITDGQRVSGHAEEHLHVEG